MERFSRILIIIFILVLTNLGLNFYLINKVNNLEKTKIVATNVTPFVTTSPLPQQNNKATNITNNDSTASDITIIKAEIRSLREILGTTRTFEELSNLIKTLEP